MSDEELVAKAKKLLGNYERLRGLIDIMDKEYYLLTKDASIIGVLDSNLVQLEDSQAYSIITMSKFFIFNAKGNHSYKGREILFGGEIDGKE